MHKVDVLTDLPKLQIVNKKFVEWLKMTFNDSNLSVCKLPTSTVCFFHHKTGEQHLPGEIHNANIACNKQLSPAAYLKMAPTDMAALLLAPKQLCSIFFFGC